MNAIRNLAQLLSFWASGKDLFSYERDISIRAESRGLMSGAEIAIDELDHRLELLRAEQDNTPRVSKDTAKEIYNAIRDEATDRVREMQSVGPQ